MCVRACKRLIYRTVTILKTTLFGWNFNISETISHKNIEIALLNKIKTKSNLSYINNFQKLILIKTFPKITPWGDT